MKGNDFFEWKGIRQPVNSWLAIALISLMAFWTVLYYFVETAKMDAEALVLMQTNALNDLNSNR